MAAASQYDKSKDELLGDVCAFQADGTELRVQIYSYSGGKRKIQLSRKRIDKHTGDMMFAKLGRLSYEEFAAVAQTVRDLKTKGHL